MFNVSRRRFLSRSLKTSAMAFGLPFLNIFLNENGNALASGDQLPVRYGTWFWGLGMNKEIFVPKVTGSAFEFEKEIASLDKHRKNINILSNFNSNTNGKPNHCHYTGWVIIRCGDAPVDRNDLPGKSFDVSIAESIGQYKPFKTINISATGDARDTYSFYGKNAYNVPEVSPLELYRKVFGQHFVDPNADGFNPDPMIMAERSVLSTVVPSTSSFKQYLGHEDLVRLDEYYSSIRSIEQQLLAYTKEPDPIPGCFKPELSGHEVPKGLDATLVRRRHDLMAKILAMSMVCDQARVFNIAYSNSFAATVRQGFDKGHHTLTHEEIVDRKLGYQPKCSWFTERSMECLSSFIDILSSFPEGDGTLLDNTFVVAHSDVSFAKTHSIEGIPMFTIGKCGGKVRTGLHVDGKGSQSTKVPLTALKLAGGGISEFGVGSNKATTVVEEILA